MNAKFQAGMAEATALTRAGRLGEATALIQRLLTGADTAGAGDTGHPPTGQAPIIIDADYVTLDTESLPPSGPTATAQPQHSKPKKAATPGKMGRRGNGIRAGVMAGLGDTLRDLAARVGPASPPPVMEPLPEGAAFTTASFTGPTGSRDYKLYVPAGREGQSLPLVVMLHGCTQSPDDFAAGTKMNALAEELGFLIAYPSQTHSANAQKCWNWFSPDHQRRDAGEPALIAGITRQIMRDHRVDPARVYIAGLSAGGAAASIMGAAYPDLYAAVGVHSGLAGGAAHDLPSALGAMRQGATGRSGRGTKTVPTIIFHGDQDRTVHPGNGDAVAAQSTARVKGLHTTDHRGRSPGGHGYSRKLHADHAGRVVCEHWVIEGAGHAWAGGSPTGSYTDPRGPDASREMLRFFLTHRNPAAKPAAA